jgi:hypothetical protein
MGYAGLPHNKRGLGFRLSSSEDGIYNQKTKVERNILKGKN